MFEAQAIICPLCDKSNRSEARFCAYCGRSLPRAVEPRVLEPKKSQFERWFKPAGDGTRTLVKLGIPGTPRCWTTYGRNLFIAVDQGGMSALYGLDIKSVRQGRAATRLGTIPPTAGLVAPIAATRHGVFIVTSERVVFFKAHGPGAGARPFAGPQIWEAAPWRIAGATPDAAGDLWVAGVLNGIASLFRGNGQSGSWDSMRILAEVEVGVAEGAALLAATGADGDTILALAVKGRVAVYVPRSGEVNVKEMPGVTPVPATLDQRVAVGLPPRHPPAISEMVSSMPIYLSGATASGMGLLTTRGAVPLYSPISTAPRAIASGFSRDGTAIFVLPEGVMLASPQPSERRLLRVPMDGGALPTATCVGAAGDWIAFAGREPNSNFAELKFLKPGPRQHILELHEAVALRAATSDRSTALSSLPPVSTDDALFVMILRNDDYELLFADLSEAT